MQKNSITNKITPCCGLPFSVIYWWVSNLTLNSEADRQYLLTQISQSGVLSIDGWKVLINSGTLEADASLTKAEFLEWFDCGRQPSCEQLKLIIEGLQVGGWTPEGIQTIINNFYQYDMDDVVPSEALYNDFPETLAGDILKRVDKVTGENVNYREVTKWKDGTNMTDAKVDGVVFIKRNSKYYKRVYSQLDVRWFGAKGDGIDGGFNNYNGDHIAINKALSFGGKVVLKDGVFIVKKPLVLSSGNELIIEPTAVLKLGDGSNCTLIKNEHIDIPHDRINPVNYPVNFKRNKNIRIYGGGVIDGNGLKQNRANNAAVGDRPEVIGTEIFTDGDGANYFGALMKFADIDNLIVHDITIKNPRTYALAAGGLFNYTFRDIFLQRDYHIENGDGIHLHGHCYSGVIENIKGQSSDDFIAVTTSEASLLSIRVGDVIGLKIRNLYNYGIKADDTEVTNGIPPNTRNSRCVRLTYTDNIIDDVTIENIRGYNPAFMSQVVMAYLHLTGFSGTNGKIGNVVIRGVVDENGCTPISVGAKTKIDHITLKDVYYEYSEATEVTALLRPTDNFGAPEDYELTEIGTIIMDNIYLLKGNTLYSAPNGLIWVLGQVKNIYINNLIVENKTDQTTSFDSLVSGKVSNFQITNSIVNVVKIIKPENAWSEMYFKEINTVFKNNNSETVVGFVCGGFYSETIILPTTPTNPRLGDKILKADGFYFRNPATGAWEKLN